MTYVLSFLLIINNLIIVLWKRHIKLFGCLLLLFMWVLFWANNFNPDYNNYVKAYDDVQSGITLFGDNRMEIGYMLLMKAGSLLGLSYDFFLAVITAFSFLLIHSTVRRYSMNYNFVYLLYFAIPFFMDVIQVRNFIIMSILIYSSRFLQENTRRAKFKYIFLMLLAATIHISALFYLPMVIIHIGGKNRFLRGAVGFILILSLVILANGKQIPFFGAISGMLADSMKIVEWLNTRTNWGFLIYWFLQASSFFMTWYANRIIRIIKKPNAEIMIALSSQLSRKLHYPDLFAYVELVYWMNTLAFIFFPLYIFASTFTRLMRNLLLLNYISFGITYAVMPKNSRRGLYFLLIVVYVGLFFYLEQCYPYKESILGIIMNNNMLFK
jgi:hypothetical protein